jgi:hypothetical protein
VDGAYALTVNGTATLGGAVGGGTSLASVTLNDAANLNGGSVTTTRAQTYNGTVTLGADTTINAVNAGTPANGTIELAGVAGGYHNLTLNNSGLLTLNGTINNVKLLTASGTGTVQDNYSITANSINDQEPTTLNNVGTVTTVAGNGQTGSQTYGATVTLSAGATTLAGTTIGLLDGVIFNGQSLTLDNSEQATFGGTFTEFDKLTFNGSMAIAANTVLDGTTFTVPAVTGNNYNLTLGNSGAATLSGAVSGLNLLTFDNSGAVTVNGAVSGVNTLTVDGSGTLTVNTTISAGSVGDTEGTTLNGTVSTTGDQDYSGTVSLGGNSTLNAVNTLTPTLGGRSAA